MSVAEGHVAEEKWQALKDAYSARVKKLEPACYAETMLCTIQGGHYPAGVYTVLYEDIAAVVPRLERLQESLREAQQRLGRAAS